MDNVKVEAALRQLALDVKKIINERISRYGINPRTSQNTLENSNLQRTLGVYPTENGIEVQIADYWEYIALGWRRTHRFEGTMSLFIRNIDDWVRRKNIRFGNMTQSQIVYAIINNIMKNGIKARPFMVYDKEGDLEKMIPELNEKIDEWFDTLFEAIIKDLEKYFNE